MGFCVARITAGSWMGCAWLSHGARLQVEKRIFGYWRCGRCPPDVSVTFCYMERQRFSTDTERSAALAFLLAQRERFKPLQTRKYLQDGALVCEWTALGANMWRTCRMATTVPASTASCAGWHRRPAICPHLSRVK